MAKSKKQIYEDRRKYLIGRGICVRCGRNKSVNGKRTCSKCYEILNAYQREYKKKNADKIKKTAQERYKRLKEQKKCPKCKKKVLSEKHVYCQRCRTDIMLSMVRHKVS